MGVPQHAVWPQPESEAIMNYLKALAVVLATALSLVVAGLTGDNHISSVEWINIATGVVTALGVFAAPNVPGARYTKLILAALGAVLTLSVNLIADGVTISEWLQLALAGLGALGVYAAPYTPEGSPYVNRAA